MREKEEEYENDHADEEYIWAIFIIYNSHYIDGVLGFWGFGVLG